MTNSDKINKLDKYISQMNAYLGCASPHNDMAGMGTRAKNDAINILKEIGAPQYSISAMQNIFFGAAATSSFGGENYNTRDIRDENRCNAYRQSVNAIINILNQERERLIKEQADEEQKKIYDAQMASNKMQKESILWAKIAAFASIISIFVSIILYLCNN